MKRKKNWHAERWRRKEKKRIISEEQHTKFSLEKLKAIADEYSFPEYLKRVEKVMHL